MIASVQLQENAQNLTLPIILAIAGCVALLIGLFGGGIKAKEITIPKLSFVARSLSSLVGAALIGTAIWLPTNSQAYTESGSSPGIETEPALFTPGVVATDFLQPLPTDLPTKNPGNPPTATKSDPPSTATPIPEFASASQWSDYFCLENEICTTADVNGDGKADLIAFLRDTQPEPGRYDVYVGLSTGASFAPPSKWSDYFCLENEICTAADVNGDGKADLIAFLRDTQPEPGRYDVYVGLSTGAGFAAPIKWSDFFCIENETCTAADVNGDGKADLVAFLRDTQPEPGRYDVYVSLSTGDAFEWPSKWSDFFCLENEICTTADVNGDGKSDLIVFVRDTQQEPARYDVYVAISTGQSFEWSSKWSDFFCLENEVCTAADVNADGRADLITFLRNTQPEPGNYDVYVGLSTGGAFDTSVKWSDYFCLENEDCSAADVNGDGRADLIAFLRDSQPEPGRYDVYVSLKNK
jgi:hypothetical protein